jgi:hypothetical protein
MLLGIPTSSLGIIARRFYPLGHGWGTTGAVAKKPSTSVPVEGGAGCMALFKRNRVIHAKRDHDPRATGAARRPSVPQRKQRRVAEKGASLRAARKLRANLGASLGPSTGTE